MRGSCAEVLSEQNFLCPRSHWPSKLTFPTNILYITFSALVILLPY